MIPDIVHSATYPHRPELVWRALTTSGPLAAWLMQNDLGEATPGHRFRFRDRPRPFWDGICECEVAEADAPRRLVLRWGVGGKGSPSTVSWTLTPTLDGGARLDFRHGGLAGVMGWIMKKGMEKGWRRILDRRLPAVLDDLAAGKVPSREEIAARTAAQ